MIPILYESTETTFTSNGLGRLSDCISCTVTEERNGIYECEFEYPVAGSHYDDITLGRIIGATHDDNEDVQPFVIYGRSNPINEVVTFYAHHISYRLNAMTTAPFSVTGCAAALAALVTYSYTANGFTFSTDISSSTAYELTEPTAIRSALGGIEGSILDTFGGEYEFDKLTVTLHAARGSTKDVAIRYAKNLVDYEDEVDVSEEYNAVVPYWTGADATTGEDVTITGSMVSSGQTVFDGTTRVIPMDLSGDFDTEPTAAELQTLAASRMSETAPWLPDQNITVDFVQLWQLPEYEDYAALEQLGLCDTVTVVFPAYGMSAAHKVVKTVFDVLRDRYSEIELGKLSTTLADAINVKTEKTLSEVVAKTKGIKAIADNTNQYFWVTETGTDTGAHITETPRAEFLAAPANGGPNLLARSTGVAVRDGLTELARFEADGAQIGADDEGHITIETDGMRIYPDDGGTETVRIGLGNYGTSASPDYKFYARFGASGANCVYILENPTGGILNGADIPRLAIANEGVYVASLYKDDPIETISGYDYEMAGTLKLGGSAAQSRGLVITGESKTRTSDSSTRYGIGRISVRGSSGEDNHLSIDIRGDEKIYAAEDTLRLENNGGYVDIDSDGLFVNGHADQIGCYESDENSSAVSLATATWKAVCKIYLTEGTYVLVGHARFSANASGVRIANISNTSAYNWRYCSANAAASGTTDMNFTYIVKVTAATEGYYYLNQYQNSGSTLTAPASGSRMYAVRIA